MPGVFNYNPGVTDQRGAYIAQGLSQGFESLSEGIQRAKQKHDENKAYAQLAGVLGLDPKKATKQNVQVAMLKNEFMQAQQQRQQQQAGRAALARFAPTFQSLMKPRAQVTAPPLGSMYKTALTSPGDMITRSTPGMSASDALATALAQNPALFGDDKSTAAALNIAKLLGRMGNNGITIDANTGLPVLRNGNSVRPINPAWLRPPADRNTFSTINIPGGGVVYRAGNEDINPRDIIGGPTVSSKSGKYPRGAKVSTLPDGKAQVTMPDGSFDIIGNPPSQQWDPDEDPITTNNAGPEDEPGKTKMANAPQSDGKLPTVTTQDSYDALESGAQYIGEDGQIYQKPESKLFIDRSGKQFRYTGNAEDPTADTNSSNWQLITQ